ncbi:MAG TPA: serine/threonine-protein kinase [Terriglobales bacterium]
MAFDIGQTVGDYEIVSMLGVGGMGRVYRVRNVISDRTEAMKVLLPDLVAEPDLAGRFISEIRMLASFDHPNIAQLHTAFQVDNQLVMMMEFVEGSTLEQIAKQSPIPQSDVIKYIQQVLAALSYAHSRGVIHRDIKPANIMVTSQGVVKLMDFGIAKSRTEQDLTRPGTTMGSLYYMSPEQVRGGTVDARSDIYSVGVMMYELLAGRRPFVADSAYEILNQQCNVIPQPPLEVNAQLPPPLSDIIVCAMAKDPANRFQNAQALSNALRQVAAMQNDPTKREEAAYTPVPIPAAAQPAAQQVTPLASAAVLAQPSSGHRGVWMTVGALAVLVVVACAAIGLPRLLHTSAKTESDGDRTAQTSQAAPSTPAPEPANPVPAAVPSPAAPPPAEDAPPAANSAAGNTPQAPVPPSTEKSPRPKVAVNGKSLRPDYQPAAEADVAAQAATTKPPVNPGPSAEEVAQIHEQMTGLDARASAVSASVEGLKRQQEADGLGLRRDMAAAYARMNSYLRSANDELNGGNITAARSHMDKADKEISTLESFLGK